MSHQTYFIIEYSNYSNSISDTVLLVYHVLATHIEAHRPETIVRSGIIDDG